MQILTKSLGVKLATLACVSFLAVAHWRAMPEVATTGAGSAARMEMILSNQKALDDIHRTILDIRDRASRVSPAQRAVLEQELISVEQMLRQTQKQLLLYGAEDEATRRLIDRSFTVRPTP